MIHDLLKYVNQEEWRIMKGLLNSGGWRRAERAANEQRGLAVMLIHPMVCTDSAEHCRTVAAAWRRVLMRLADERPQDRPGLRKRLHKLDVWLGLSAVDCLAILGCYGT
jgi:hypothetical protein